MPHQRPASAKNIDVSGADVVVLGPSPGRWGIILGAPAIGTITYFPGAIAALGNGFSLTAGEPPLHFHGANSGNIAQSEWHAFANGANRLSAVIEIMFSRVEKQENGRHRRSAESVHRS